MSSNPPKRPPGRPPGTIRTDRIPHVRCTPEQRAKWERLGGAAWMLRMIERAKEPG